MVTEGMLAVAMPAYLNLIELGQIVENLEPGRFDIDINMFVGPKLRIIVKRSGRDLN